MKRIGNLYSQICSIENLQLADEIARKRKKNKRPVIQHDLNRDGNIAALHDLLVNKKFTTSAYKTFKIYEPKERTIFSLPYYPDRIVHHAVMNVLEPVFVRMFTADTYSCIKGRGVHGASRALRNGLQDVEGTIYSLKLDIKKFYPSIDHDMLKALLRKKFKDDDLLWLLDNVIDSVDGVPIGNYLSQYFANFYLTYFDHWIKEVLKVKYYFRYADDIVILHSDKKYLHEVLVAIREYLSSELKLTIKSNYQIFPVKARGIDFVGYVFYHTHILLRKGIKKNFARMIARRNNPLSIASYKGWAYHCNSFNLLKKLLMKTFKELGLKKSDETYFSGDKIAIKKILGKEIVVTEFQIEDSKIWGSKKCLYLQITYNGESRVVFTSAKKLIADMAQIENKSESLPFTTTIRERESNHYEFT